MPGGRVYNDNAKVYIGDLPRDARRDEIERAFDRYGKVEDVWLASNPPGFGFVFFEDELDARDSVKALDGRTICGVKVRVEMSRNRFGESRPRGGGRDGGGGGRRFDDHRDRPPPPMRGGGRECYNCGEIGHLSRDCRNRRSARTNGGFRRRSRSYSRSPRRSPSYSRSRSRSPPRYS